jgi:hypothetical protein
MGGSFFFFGYDMTPPDAVEDLDIFEFFQVIQTFMLIFFRVEGKMNA